MHREPIPEELHRFILTSVRSVPVVEAVLLYRAAKGEPLDVRTLSQRLYLPEKQAAEIAAELHEAGVLERDAGLPDSYRYAPSSPELAGMLEMLAHFYASHLVDVARLIHSSTGARRAMQFADAFKLRKDP
jgi:DNA-binding IclR family transcriptional regulator